jgi:hypothetical protein
MTTSEDFDAAVERYHQAAAEFVKGNNETYKALFSQGEDVTVANPFSPPPVAGRTSRTGWTVPQLDGVRVR